ncbi:MAG: hypothetical protein QGI11_14160, partial [Nitrospinota bacterium]|nr:hypothetical protein [Nitrospinota bacterium]
MNLSTKMLTSSSSSLLVTMRLLSSFSSVLWNVFLLTGHWREAVAPARITFSAFSLSFALCMKRMGVSLLSSSLLSAATTFGALMPSIELP